MTLTEPGPTAARSRSAATATATAGGVGFLVAGTLQLLGAARVVLPSAAEGVAPGWQLLGWLVGGLVLLAASCLLAAGWRGERGIAGPGRWARAALVISGTGSLLLVVLSVGSLVVGPSGWSGTTVLLVLGQLLILTTTCVAAVAVLRAGVLAGAARWVLVVPAAVDAVATVLALVPASAVAFLTVVVVVRPVAVMAVGAVLVLRRREPRARRA